MFLDDIIEKRRSFRALKKTSLKDDTIKKLAQAARLAPSCYNKQPWRYVFVKDKGVLNGLYETLSSGNEWAKNSSMIIAVFSEKNEDCIVAKRNYYLFDTGMSVGFMLLKATELGLVAHPIAGYSESSAKEVLNIPEKKRLITLIIVGKKTENTEMLSDEQTETEKKRPKRKKFNEFAFLNKYEK